MHPQDPTGFTPGQVWEIGIHIVPILIAVILATVKIVSVLRAEIRAEIGPIMDKIDAVEKKLISAVRDLWEHNASQDIRIDAVTNAHHRLRGAHDVYLSMGGHKNGVTYKGPERRKEARETTRKCEDP